MLTINPNIVSYKGIRLQNKNQKTNQNSDLYNVQSIPQNDVFTKNDINFTGFFEKKPLPVLGKPITQQEMNELEKRLEEKNKLVWNHIIGQPEYSEYFDRLQIAPPEVELLKRGETAPADFKEGRISRYNWAKNTITIDTHYLPNMALISKGNIVLVSQDFARRFIRNSTGDIPLENEFEDLGENKSIGFALENSEESGKSYYYKLSPEEAAEIATQYIAQEMNRVIAFHVLLNTETIGGEHELINNYYDNLKDTRKLQPNTTGFWIDTYACDYKEANKSNYPKYRINGPERWEIQNGKPNYSTAISHKQLYQDFIATDNNRYNPKSLLELSSMIAAKRFMENYIPNGNNERETERLGYFYESQLYDLEQNIEKRIKTIKAQR